jgi:hypothetical protein
LTGSAKELIRIRVFFINLILLTIIWTVASFNYYLINFELKYINGDIFNNFMISSASEIVSFIFAGIMFQIIGMKPSFVISFGIALTGSVTYMAYGSDGKNKLIPLMILGAKFGISSTFNIAYLSNIMLYPPILATTAFGICNLFARVATIVAPELAEIPNPVPMGVFSGLCILAIVSSVLLIKKKPKII